MVRNSSSSSKPQRSTLHVAGAEENSGPFPTTTITPHSKRLLPHLPRSRSNHHHSNKGEVVETTTTITTTVVEEEVAVVGEGEGEDVVIKIGLPVVLGSSFSEEQSIRFFCFKRVFLL